MEQNPVKDTEVRFLIRMLNLSRIFNFLIIFCPILWYFHSAFLYHAIWRWFEQMQCIMDGKPECRDSFTVSMPDTLWGILGVMFWDILRMWSKFFVNLGKSLDNTRYCFRKDAIADMSAAREEGRFHECLLHTLPPFYTLIAIFLMYNATYVIFRMFGRYDRIFEVLDYPLHFSVKHNHYFHLKFYLSLGGWDVNGSEPNYGIRSPLNYVNCNHPNIVSLLLRSGADIRKTDLKLIYRAVKTGNQETLDLLIDAGIDNVHLYTTVQVAVMLGKSDVLKYLVENGGLINMEPGVHSPIHLAVEQQSTDMVKILLDAGADVMSQGKNGNTPAHLAAKYRNRGLASMLIYRMENLEQINSDGYTALHLAVKARNGVVTKLLLDSGANVHAKNFFHLSALHMACSDPHEDMLIIIELLLNKGASINDMTPNRLTAFHLAAQYQKVSTVQMLLQKDANPKIVTFREETILHFAAANKEDREVLKLFISMGFKSGVKTHSGHTPITYAAQYGAFRNYLFLLRNYMRVLKSDEDSYEVFKTLQATATGSLDQEAGNASYYKRFEMKLLEQVEEQLVKEASSDVARTARVALRYVVLADHKSENKLYHFFFSEINSQKVMRKYYIRCEKELIELERLRLLDPVITMLTGNDEELLNYTQHVDTLYKVWEHRYMFPLYHKLIREVFYPVVRAQAHTEQNFWDTEQNFWE